LQLGGGEKRNIRNGKNGLAKRPLFCSDTRGERGTGCPWYFGFDRKGTKRKPVHPTFQAPWGGWGALGKKGNTPVHGHTRKGRRIDTMKKNDGGSAYPPDDHTGTKRRGGASTCPLSVAVPWDKKKEKRPVLRKKRQRGALGNRFERPNLKR